VVGWDLLRPSWWQSVPAREKTVGMAKKRSKLDRLQRQSDQLEKRADTRPEQTPKKRKPHEEFRQAAVRIVREETGNHTMERIFTCQNATCRKSFKAASPGRQSDYAELPEVDAEAICTYCGTLNRITWPKGVTFITTPLTVPSPEQGKPATRHY